MATFTIDTTKSHAFVSEGVKYYYSKESVTLYFMEGKHLAGIPEFTNESTFNTEDSFIVEKFDEELAKEEVGFGLTLGQTWQLAESILNGKNIVVQIYSTDDDDTHNHAVATLFDTDSTDFTTGGSEIEWFDNRAEQLEKFHSDLAKYHGIIVK